MTEKEDIPSFASLTSSEIAAQAAEEKARANRDSCRKVLSEAQGIEGEGERGGDLPEVNGAELCDRQEPKQGTRKGIRDKEKKARQQSHLAQFNFRKDKHNPSVGLDRTVGVHFRKAVARKMELYRGDALDALYDIAMQPIVGLGDKEMAWKFEAARFLASGLDASGKAPTNEFADVLKQLDKSYRENAPKIKEVRERSIIFENDETKLIN